MKQTGWRIRVNNVSLKSYDDAYHQHSSKWKFYDVYIVGMLKLLNLCHV